MECGKVALQYWYPQVKLQELQDIKKWLDPKNS